MQNYPRVLIEPANLQREKTTLPTDRSDPLLFSLLLCFPGGEATVLFFLDGGGGSEPGSVAVTAGAVAHCY